MLSGRSGDIEVNAAFKNFSRWQCGWKKKGEGGGSLDVLPILFGMAGHGMAHRDT
jgi:hypothetical protein